MDPPIRLSLEMVHLRACVPQGGGGTMISLTSERAAQALAVAVPKLYEALVVFFQEGGTLTAVQAVAGQFDVTPLQQDAIEMALPWMHAEYGGKQ